MAAVKPEEMTQSIMDSTGRTESQTPLEIGVPGRSPVPVPTVPVGLVPTPTAEYRLHRHSQRALIGTGMAPQAAATPLPIPVPLPLGTRALIWKQDPSVKAIGIRAAFLPSLVLAGPRDARITQGAPGLPPVNPNADRDFIETPGTDAFDAVHTFAVVRMTLTMYQRALGGITLPWQWNAGGNTDPLSVFPHAGITPNAYYSRNEKALKFFYFNKQGDPPIAPKIFTCRSLDIVAHETGHAILDGLKPNWISSNTPQTGGLHESFGDMTAIFLALTQFDLLDALIVLTKGNLHLAKGNFLADLAEEFGLALGRPNGLRNADNNLKLSEAGTEVHAISQVMTGAVYDILADIFAFERNVAKRDDAALLAEVGGYLAGLVLRALIAAPNTNATYADVANQMLKIAATDGKPVQYRTFIRNQFTRREVVVSPTPLAAGQEDDQVLEAAVMDLEGAIGDRRRCCGTMRSPEFTGALEGLETELHELRASFSDGDSANLAQQLGLAPQSTRKASSKR